MEKSDKGGAGANVPPADQTNFQLLRVYFQNAFTKYFESVILLVNIIPYLVDFRT